jgi:hypothetical protein
MWFTAKRRLEYEKMMYYQNISRVLAWSRGKKARQKRYLILPEREPK